VDTVLQIFGADRVMFGSDWPVCTLVASYDEVVGALRTVLDRLGPLTPETQRKIWGETAARWYRLAG
jgi:L-fuconolactonase